MSDKDDKQSGHEAAVIAAAEIYFDFGMYCWIKADCDKENEQLKIDLFAAGNPDGDKGWGIAFETTDSVSENQAESQWLKYAQTFNHWYLAVPVPLENSTSDLLGKFNIENCSFVTWQQEEDESFSFWGLPGLPTGPHKKRRLKKTLHPDKKS